MMYLLALWVFWLFMAALIFRWVVGGIIDVFKKGSSAKITSWMGFVVGIVIILVLYNAFG